MATIDNYKIKITVDGQDKVIDLNDSLDKLSGSLNKVALAGVAAFSAMGASAVKMAADIGQLSKATGISVGQLYNLNRALEVSGGNFGDADKMIRGFSNTLNQVEKGSKDAIDGLMKLGLSRSEIENLSDEQLFNKAVQGLAKMENGFEKTRLATELFGKSAATLDFDSLAQGLEKTVDPKIQKQFEDAAAAVDNLATIFRELQLVVLDILSPFIEQLAQLEFNGEKAKKVIQVLGALIAAAFAASVVLQMRKVIDLYRRMGGIVKGLATAKAFFVGLSGVGLAAVAAAGIAATAAYVALGQAIGDAADEQERLDGDTGTTATGGAPERTVGITPQQRALAAVREQTRQMRERNNEANKYQRILIGTIGLNQQEADRIRAMADLERQAGNEKLQIQQKIDAELSKGAETNKDIVREYQKQLLEVDKQLVAQKQLKNEEIQRYAQLKTSALELKNLSRVESFEAEYILLKNIEEAHKTIGEKRQFILNYGKQEYDINKATLPILKEINQELLGEIQDKEKRNQLEKIYKDLIEDTKIAVLDSLTGQKDAEESIQTILQLRATVLEKIIELNGEISDEQKKQLDELLKAVQLETQRVQILDSINNAYDKNNSYLQGSLDALDQITKQFEPYQMAQDAILSTWGKISNAVDDFVKTGKFKFSDFAKSVLRDLAAMILKAQIFKAISGLAGAFGLKIPGLASGGPAKAGQPYIVGEKGPELFVPKQSGTVIPNNKLDAATAKAGGGTVNAPITNNYITNNINAVDAKSVAQLFAENRKTLLGAVATAQREMPYMA